MSAPLVTATLEQGGKVLVYLHSERGSEETNIHLIVSDMVLNITA